MNILMLNHEVRNKGTFYRPYNWAKYLVQAGHCVTIVCAPWCATTRSRTTDDHGIKIIETPGLLNPTRLMVRLSGAYGWGIEDIYYRYKEILEGDYDVVHTFEHFPNVSLPFYLIPRSKRPVMVADWCDHYGKGGFREAHYGDLRLGFFYRKIGFPLKCFMDFWEGYHRRKAAAVTVISRYLFRRALDKGVSPNRIFLIPGSIDTCAVRPLDIRDCKKKINIDERKKVISFLGSAQFDVDFALQAFSIVVRHIPESLFLVIGAKEKSFEQDIREAGLSGRVIQTGWCPDEMLPIYLSASDVFLLPMRDNPVNQARWPNKIGEYIAAGRPIVCTAVGDVGNLVSDEEIGLVSEANSRDFARKIIALLQDDAQAFRMGRKARKIAETRFNLNVQGVLVESLYKSILGERY